MVRLVMLARWWTVLAAAATASYASVTVCSAGRCTRQHDWDRLAPNPCHDPRALDIDGAEIHGMHEAAPGVPLAALHAQPDLQCLLQSRLSRPATSLVTEHELAKLVATRGELCVGSSPDVTRSWMELPRAGQATPQLNSALVMLANIEFLSDTHQAGCAELWRLARQVLHQEQSLLLAEKSLIGAGAGGRMRLVGATQMLERGAAAAEKAVNKHWQTLAVAPRVDEAPNDSPEEAVAAVLARSRLLVALRRQDDSRVLLENAHELCHNHSWKKVQLTAELARLYYSLRMSREWLATSMLARRQAADWGARWLGRCRTSNALKECTKSMQSWAAQSASEGLAHHSMA